MKLTLSARKYWRRNKMGTEKTPEFYKKFYEENRIPMLQYESLRSCFNSMITKILGENYYNMGMDVYTCDEICCEDITSKAKSRNFLEHILKYWD